MKSIFAILALGLMLAAVFSGCVGGENTNTIDTTTGTDTNFENETENQTIVNETGPVTPNYHQEFSDSQTIVDGAIGTAYYTFPVSAGAKKIILTMTVSATPGVAGVGFWIESAEGDEMSEDFVTASATRELKEKEVKRGGTGDWSVAVCIQAPDLTADYTFTVDVLYS